MKRTPVVLFLLLGACSEESSLEPEPMAIATVAPAPPPTPLRNSVHCMTEQESREMDAWPPPMVGPYGAGKLHSGGCVPSLEWSGVPSATGPGTFVVRAVGLPPNVPAYLVYGTEPRLDPFEGGYQCVGGTVHDLPARDSGGAGLCRGSIEFDLTSLLRSGSDPMFCIDARVFCQVRFRDDGDPAGYGSGSTNALRIVVQP